MSKIVVYSMKGCAQCVQAMNLLTSKGVGFDVVKVDEDADAFELMQEMGLRSMPQLFLFDVDCMARLGDYKALTKLTDEQWEALKKV